MNVQKPRSKLTSKNNDVIFQFWNPKRKKYKVHMNNAPSKAFKNVCFEKIKLKNKKIVTHMNLWKYGPIQSIQKSQTMIWFKLTRNTSWFEFIISYYNTYWVSNKNLEWKSIQIDPLGFCN